jgi:hypothetical protein
VVSANDHYVKIFRRNSQTEHKLVKKMLMTTNHMINTKEKIGGCIKSDTKLMVHNKGKHGEN